MKHEFSNEAPMLRLVFAVAAVSVTLSIGGFIDFLAVGYAGVDVKHRPVLTVDVPSSVSMPASRNWPKPR